MQPWHSTMKRKLYLEMHVLGVGLGASLVHAMGRMQFSRNEVPNNAALQKLAFACKSKKSAETHYSNIEREVLGRLHGLDKFNHHSFAHEVSVITNQKLLVALFKKDLANLPHRLQRIL